MLLSWETGKEMSRLQGESERDCTAKSKEQKQGLASQVMERGLRLRGARAELSALTASAALGVTAA